jgi:hypothetical protein
MGFEHSCEPELPYQCLCSLELKILQYGFVRHVPFATTHLHMEREWGRGALTRARTHWRAREHTHTHTHTHACARAPHRYTHTHTHTIHAWVPCASGVYRGGRRASYDATLLGEICFKMEREREKYTSVPAA